MSINSNQHYKNVIYNKMLITSLFPAAAAAVAVFAFVISAVGYRHKERSITAGAVVKTHITLLLNAKCVRKMVKMIFFILSFFSISSTAHSEMLKKLSPLRGS
jgi:hypothetical protein